MTLKSDILTKQPGLFKKGSVSLRFILIPLFLCMLFSVGASALPTANFTGTPLTGIAPLSVTFTDLSTGAGLTNWSWNFGDGNITNLTASANPVHIYLTAGQKTVNLTVTDGSGSNSTLRTS